MEQKKTKKKYCKPEIRVEEFTPSEYVAVCWQLGCSVEDANKWEKEHNSSEVHNASSCGLTASQVIGENGMKEVSSGALEQNPNGLKITKIYSDENYSTPLSFTSITSGQKIYWITESGNRSWHHQGTVSAIMAARPNMS